MSKGNPHASARRLRKAALSTTVYGGMENDILAVLDSLAALVRRNKLLTARAEKAEAKLTLAVDTLIIIKHSGGTTDDEGCSCNGTWCAEQACRTIEQIKG